MKRNTVMAFLIALEVGALGSLGFQANDDGHVHVLAMGLHLAVFSVAFGAIVWKCWPQEDGQLWPDDLGDVWDDDDDEPATCGSERPHDPHEFIHTNEAGTEPLFCVGVDSERPCETTAAHPGHTWAADDDPRDDHNWCPGVEERAEAVSGH